MIGFVFLNAKTYLLKETVFPSTPAISKCKISSILLGSGYNNNNTTASNNNNNNNFIIIIIIII